MRKRGKAHKRKMKEKMKREGIIPHTLYIKQNMDSKDLK